MTQKLAYKHNAGEAVERLSALWSHEAYDRIFAHMVVPTKTLTSFTAEHEDGMVAYPDPAERIKFWDSHLAELADLKDDWLPIAYLSEFDQGIYAGAVGATMRFLLDKATGWISSMTPPIIDDPDLVYSLRINEQAEVIKLMDNQCKIFAETARGKFGIAPFIVIDALNFVAEMRGMTRAFEDTFEHPEEALHLMDFAFDLNVFIQTRVQSMLDGFAGGNFANMAGWAPGRPVLFSVDAYHMASPDFYYKWGEPHISRLLNHFGGGILHVHSNGRHLLPHVAKLKHLIGIYLIDENWNVRAYDELEKLQSDAGDVPLIVDCKKQEFEHDLDSGRLPGNVLYQVQEVESVEAANHLMDKVRAYRR